MAVAFTTGPGHCHVLPMLPIAEAVRRRGHEVVFGLYYQDAARRRCLEELGFEVVESDLPVDDIQAQRRERFPELMDVPAAERWRISVASFGASYAPAAYRTFRGLFEQRPFTLVVHEQTDLAGPLAARAANLPYVTILESLPFDEEWLAVLRASVTPLADTIGAPLDLREWYPSPYATLSPWPPSLRDAAHPELPGTRHIRTSAPAGLIDEDLPEWLNQRPDRLVYVTLGTVFGETELFRAILEGLADLKTDVVATVGPDGDVATLAREFPWAHVEHYLPLASLLPVVDAVVCHGGSGTVLAALAHGLPLVILPLAADQFVNARLLETSGAGVSLTAHVCPATIAGAVQQVLSNPAHVAAAKGLQEEIAALPPVEEVVEDLLPEATT